MYSIIKKIVKNKEKLKVKLDEEKSSIEKEIKNISDIVERGNVDVKLQEPEYESSVGDLVNKENNNSIKDNLKIRLNEIKAALNRMKNKKYGLCVECGGEINLERLEVNPSAIYCLNCAEKLEKNEEA